MPTASTHNGALRLAAVVGTSCQVASSLVASSLAGAAEVRLAAVQARRAQALKETIIRPARPQPIIPEWALGWRELCDNTDGSGG